MNYDNLSKNDIIELLLSEDDEVLRVSDETRKKYKGDGIHLRGLIEFDNRCRRNCFYCGLRVDNKKIERYGLSEEQILNCCKRAVSLNFKTVVLQSGEDMYWTVEKMSSLIKKIKEYDLAVTLSIGERSFEEYEMFRNAGADRYLLKIETTDKNLYKSLHPNMSFENRIQCLKNLKKLGYETGTGCLVGLPNQTIESLADDILFFKEINADMVGTGVFIPHPDTPLAQYETNKFDLALKVSAITRILLPDINIPATTAMETMRPNGKIIALQSGANVIMPNITEAGYGKKYEIYPGKPDINLERYLSDLKLKTEAIGRYITNSKGFRSE